MFSENMKNQIYIIILKIAGLSQVLMALGSLCLARVLHWKEGLASMPVLLRQMFWVYSGYILFTNIALGLITLLFPADLMENRSLGAAILLYAALYWLARLVLQFFYFDKKDAPEGALYRLGAVALEVNFIFLALAYLGALALSQLH